MEIRLAVAKDKKKSLKYDCHIHHSKVGECIHNGLVDVLCDGERIVALMGMRSNRTHINLVFTKKEYHRKGIARAIFEYLLKDITKENPTLEALTLNSSPYGLPFYLAIGFVPQSEEQTMNGIRFTPMKYILKE